MFAAALCFPLMVNYYRCDSTNLHDKFTVVYVVIH